MCNFGWLSLQWYAGAAPKEAAPTATDTSNKGKGVQSVADPANVDQALGSVGDAVENAVPDPKGAESGLAPTVSSSSTPASQPVSTSQNGQLFRTSTEGRLLGNIASAAVPIVLW